MGTKAAVNHHREVPFRLLQCDPALSVGGADSGNLLVQGDNLVILREHVADESVDLVYLDPPFNSSANQHVLFGEKGGEKSSVQITVDS